MLHSVMLHVGILLHGASINTSEVEPHEICSLSLACHIGLVC